MIFAMTDDSSAPKTVRLYHDFDQRWRAVLQDAAGDELETVVLPTSADGVRSAIRATRRELETRGLDVGELQPVVGRSDTWEGPIAALAPAA
jgi:hypothetical protein